MRNKQIGKWNGEKDVKTERELSNPCEKKSFNEGVGYRDYIGSSLATSTLNTDNPLISVRRQTKVSLSPSTSAIWCTTQFRCMGVAGLSFPDGDVGGT
jgi:hypothetical protein